MAILKIQDTKEFDQQVWQYETGFTNEQYQKAIDNFAEVAQRIYDAIGQCEEIDVDTTDLYQLGDLINMLSNIKVESEHQAECKTCTIGDFEEYDLSGLTDEEKDRLVNEVAHYMSNNDCVSECYWLTVEEVSEAHSLKKWYSPSEHDKDIVEYVSKHTCIDQREIDLAYDYMEKWRCPLDHASQRVYDAVASAIDDWLEDNCIATDENHWVDAEEIFNQVEKWELKNE